MKLLLIDNYDSFTYLLAQYFEELDCSVTVVNDQDKMSQKIRISPDFICETQLLYLWTREMERLCLFLGLKGL